MKEYAWECRIVKLVGNLGYIMTQQKKFTSAYSTAELLHAKEALDVLKSGLTEILGLQRRLIYAGEAQNAVGLQRLLARTYKKSVFREHCEEHFKIPGFKWSHTYQKTSLD